MKNCPLQVSLKMDVNELHLVERSEAVGTGFAFSYQKIILKDQFQNGPVSQNEPNQLGGDLAQLIEVVIQAVIKAGETRHLETALAIRNEIRRLPDSLVTEVLNQVMLRLIFVDPLLCRWFVLDVFLHDANPDAKADVAERINLLMADLRSS